MSDEIKPLAQMAKESDEIPLRDLGGDGGACTLRKSELLVLRRMMDRYPISENERAETVAQVLGVLRDAKSMRTRLSAAKVLAAMDKVNLDEVKTYIGVKMAAKDDGNHKSNGDVNISVNIVEQVVVKEQLPQEHLTGKTLRS